MPYIKQIRRDKIDSKLQELIIAIQQLDRSDLRDLDGDLNYSITKLILQVLELEKKPKYTKFNTAIGILESVKLEMYRRFIAPYENEKITENGDIV